MLELRLPSCSDGTIHIDTPFSRLLSKPPIMVAGMTLSTTRVGFASAVLSAGYHIELAGGGHYNPAALRSKVAKIQADTPTGVGSSPFNFPTNKYLPENSKLCISLHNSIKAFVITGPSRALHGLVTALRKVRAPSDLDQSKVPFSKRKPVFHVRFLLVGVPFHSPYLTDTVDILLNDDLKGEELWEADELQIPVYHTADGECLGIACAMSILTLFPSSIRYQEFRLLDYAVHHRTDFHAPAPLDQGH